MFQHTAARRRLTTTWRLILHYPQFQHTAARRRLSAGLKSIRAIADVSTHSRPKAADRSNQAVTAKAQGFNTQPPEGG